MLNPLLLIVVVLAKFRGLGFIDVGYHVPYANSITFDGMFNPVEISSHSSRVAFSWHYAFQSRRFGGRVYSLLCTCASCVAYDIYMNT